jgi:predicted dehydrogenase
MRAARPAMIVAMADDMLNVGFVGLGHNGVAHIEAHLRLGRSRVAALCDRDPGRLAEIGARFGVSRLCRSSEELCGLEHVRAVCINTGDADHVAPFLHALERGKHVFVEKPLANAAEDVRVMVEAARRADPGLKVAVGYILRFNPVFEAVHRLCSDGSLGTITFMEADYIHNLLYQAGQVDAATGSNWYLENEKPMVGGGSHPLDLLRWFSGQDVLDVAGYSNRIAFPAMRHDDCTVALYRFSGGAIGKVAALYSPRREMAPFYNLRIYGTRGTVERDTVAISRDEADVHPVFAPVEADREVGHPYDREIADWLDAIASGRQPRCDLFDGATSTMATLLATEAMGSGRALPVPAFRR